MVTKDNLSLKNLSALLVHYLDNHASGFMMYLKGAIAPYKFFHAYAYKHCTCIRNLKLQISKTLL